MNDFKTNFLCDLKNRWLINDTDEATNEMLRISLVNTIKKEFVIDNWLDSNEDISRKVHYFSMEFMVGKQLKTNLVNLDKLKEVEELAKEIGIDLENMLKNEVESKTANGGLGRLAFAILNGLSNKNVNAMGQTLLYNHGIFEQRIMNGKQIENPDIWRNIEHGYEWYNIRPNKAKICKFFGEVRTVFENGRTKYELYNYTPIKGVPYDLPVIGYKNDRVNTLRLWESREVDNKTLKELGLNNLYNSY